MARHGQKSAIQLQREIDAADRRRANKTLALGFLKTVVVPLLKQQDAAVGLPSAGGWRDAELLVEVAGVTYKLSVEVDHDD